MPPTTAPVASGVLPVVLVHGIGVAPDNWAPVLSRIGGGREVVTPFFAGDGPGLATGSVGARSLWAFGFYRERTGSPLHYADRTELASIGGIPIARDDLIDDPYAISYARQLDRAIEEIVRITGSPQVDLVCYSMGGLVGRPYTRWLSVHGGRSRVRRILIAGSPNRGVNAFEAAFKTLGVSREANFMKWGEFAEMNVEYRVYAGRSFVERLNEDWDAFCRAQGIRYGCLYAHGETLVDRIPYILASMTGGAAGAPSSSPPPPVHPSGPPANAWAALDGRPTAGWAPGPAVSPGPLPDGEHLIEIRARGFDAGGTPVEAVHPREVAIEVRGNRIVALRR